jgi:signal peptidase I
MGHGGVSCHRTKTDRPPAAGRGPTPPPRRLALLAVAALAASLAFLGRPRTFEVDGFSMAPGLLPGDVVESGAFPVCDRFRRPHRFERWVLSAADGTPAIKRIVGLPGETVSIADGDLLINGIAAWKCPRLLGEIGSRVVAEDARPADRQGKVWWRWMLPPREVLDDEQHEQGRSRVLIPVRDVGLAAVVRVRDLPPAGFVRIRANVDRSVVPWRLKARGRYAVVAGRLDGRLVAAAWPLPPGDVAGLASRSCLPPRPPEFWHVAEPWPAQDGESTMSPALTLEVDQTPDGGAEIAGVAVWRDVLHRPAADGVVAWEVGPGDCFVLGDFPSASRDSRHWGAVPIPAMRHRVMPSHSIR